MTDAVSADTDPSRTADVPEAIVSQYLAADISTGDGKSELHAQWSAMVKNQPQLARFIGNVAFRSGSDAHERAKIASAMVRIVQLYESVNLHTAVEALWLYDEDSSTPLQLGDGEPNQPA